MPTQLWKNLEKITCTQPKMTAQVFEAWMDINENLETSVALTDYEICEAVSNMNEISNSISDDEEPENVIEEEKTPTSTEMRNAFHAHNKFSVIKLLSQSSSSVIVIQQNILESESRYNHNLKFKR